MTRMSLSERRQRLVEAASRVVAREGVAGSTTRAIVAEADMPLASFHYAFESHSALMREVMIKVVTETLSLINASLSGDTLPEAVETGITAYLQIMRSGPEQQQSLLELYHYALRTPEHRGLATAAIERTYRELEATLAGFAAEHGISYTVPTRQIALHIIVVIDGYTMAVVRAGDSDLLRATVRPTAQMFASYVAQP